MSIKNKGSAGKRQQNRTEELFRKWKATSDPDLRAQLLYSVQQFLGPMLRAKFGHFSNARSMEDIFAEVQKKILYRQPDEFEDLTNLVKLVRRIAHNEIVDRIRKNGLILFNSLDEALNIATPIQSANTDLEHKERALFVQLAVDSLTEDYSEIVKMYYWKGISLSMIARIMGKSKEAINMLLVRARKSLAKKLAANFQEI